MVFHLPKEEFTNQYSAMIMKYIFSVDLEKEAKDLMTSGNLI